MKKETALKYTITFTVNPSIGPLGNIEKALLEAGDRLRSLGEVTVSEAKIVRVPVQS